jgi:predicted nucleotidyltransferase
VASAVVASAAVASVGSAVGVVSAAAELAAAGDQVKDTAAEEVILDARQVAERFAREVKEALGERLRSIVLYGSAARGEWLASVSDINVLVLLDDIAGSSLAALSPAVRRYAAERVRPIVAEQREWRKATDVFGIELAEMQDWHALLAGDDPLMGLLVQRPSLRLQAERELRGKLLQLHLGMLLAEAPAQLGALLLGSLPSLTTYFRTALRLAEQPVSPETERTLRDACALVDADPAGLLAVLHARRSGKPLELKLQDPLLDQFNTAAEQLAAYIDNYGREQP